MSKQHFLGKQIPKAVKQPVRRVFKPKGGLSAIWSLFFLLPVALGVLVVSQPSQSSELQDTELRDSSTAITRTLGSAAIVPAQGACETPEKFTAMKEAPLFPFIPAAISENPKDNPTGCFPAVWSRGVVIGLIYRALALLNWFAAAMAIILTVVAGLYYIAGFANENSVKTAKKYLTGVYVGVAIILFARLMVLATFNALNPNNIESAISNELGNE